MVVKNTGNEILGSVGPAADASKSVDVLPQNGDITIPEHIASCLPALLQAYQYAIALKRDVWDFAVELPNLYLMGLSINDLRWLVYHGLVHPAEEVEPSWGEGREFRDHGRYRFTPESCFVLSPAGVTTALRVTASGGTDAAPVLPVFQDIGVEAKKAIKFANKRRSLFPEWDGDRRELRLAGEVVKIFKLPSPNQETILSVFEEERWPVRIDDPLPQVANLNPKRRLHDTIKSLNRHQKARSIRFMGDGRGEGVVWKIGPAEFASS